MENQSSDRLCRKTAGTNRHLDDEFEWPSNFGRRTHILPRVAEESEEIHHSVVNDLGVIDEMTVRPDHSSNRQTPVQDNAEFSSKHSDRSSKSRYSSASAELQKKKLAFEAEKAKQAIETEMMKNKLKLIEMERQVREAEINENEERRSLKSSSTKHSMQYLIRKDPLYPEVDVIDNEQGPSTHYNAKSFVADWIETIPQYSNGSIPENIGTISKKPEEDKSDIKILCESLGNVLKTAVSPRQEKMCSRHVAEKDFPMFDGKPEEWMTFLYQFKKISSYCDFSPEECMIKLHKCLRGDAKFAVAGMMMSPNNLDLVLKTLEMRFGRPDQIIDVVLSRVRGLTFIKEHDLEGIIQFSNHVSCLVSTITSLEYHAHLQNPQVLKELCQKLPDTLKLRWGEVVMQKRGNVNLQDFSVWLSEIASALCFVSTPNSKVSRSSNFPPRRFEKSFTTSTIPMQTACIYCSKEGHNIENCKKLQSDDVNDRWSEITRKKLCFSCLHRNHQTKKCRNRQVCGVNGCKLPHHKYLHKETPKPETDGDSENTSSPNGIENENVLTLGNGANNVLLRMVNVRMYGPDSSFIKVVALLDEASTVTLLDSSVADYLALTGRQEPLCMQWTNGIVHRHENSLCMTVNISSDFDKANVYKMENVRTVRNLSLPFQKIISSDWEKYKYLDGLPIGDITERPLLLIGQDNIRLSVARQVVQGPEHLPIATKTNLGWILHGSSTQRQPKEQFTFHICHDQESSMDDNLHQIVRNSFSTESFGVSPTTKTMLNKAENRAMEVMQRTARRIEGRYEIGLLWKNDHIQLPISKTTAFRRLLCVEKQMEKDSNFKQRYCENIKKYVEKGYARKLEPKEIDTNIPRCWYLPHFGVISPSKPDKLRFVFDAASKSNGTSLNDNLLVGPDLLQSLVIILLKFRERKIAFSSDVREMFHQVRIRKEDQSSQRFLWRDGDSNQPIDVYEMQVMIFGATCSPTCAQFIKNLNAQECTKSERIIEEIVRKHYVDDYLDCTDTEEEALEIIHEVSRVQKMGGSELTKWTSNSKVVLDSLSASEEFSKDLNLDVDNIQRVLGLFWDAKNDNFIFQRLKLTDETERPTKRYVLKTVMSIFDPLGLIVNFSVRGRMIIQDIWRTGIGWDDSLDSETFIMWKYWLVDLKRIDKLIIPRCYSLIIPSADSIQLHVFCDGSKKAFASVAYLRVLKQENIQIALVMAKARVAPTKPISIPRLELQAAVIGSRLANTLIETLGIKIDKTYFWTDSSTVLFWIKNDGRRLGQFESHRVGEIQEATNVCDWNWVPSKSNVADLATRTYHNDGSNPTNFERWFDGPEFLLEKDETKWPTKKFSCEHIPGENMDSSLNSEVTLFMNQVNIGLPDINRFSSYLKLIRVTAWMKRYVEQLKNRIRKILGPTELILTTHEMKEAEKLWIRNCQSESFPEELKELKKDRQLNIHSRLHQLTPALEDGIIVLSGRTDLTTFLAERTRRPYILPSKHRFTILLIQYHHEKYLHLGLETVLNALRQKFWILDGRAAVRSVFAKCLKCRIRKAKPELPLMGQIPAFRLTPSARPFTYTGIDYFGPLKVKIGRHTEKRWGVIFTCMSIRAVHLEIAHSLTTDSAIMAIRRMISRRGPPRQIISDNGTNFRGAAEELKKSVRDLDKAKISEFLCMKDIEWVFLPPGAAHMAGSWERLIGSVKRCLHAILNGHSLKDETLSTFFSEIELILNSRPLTHVSIDPTDFEALTPNHWLLGSSCGDKPLGKFDGKFLRKEWRKTQQMADSFWKRWVKEYLPSLTKRTKWTHETESLKENDIVIIVDETAPRNLWRMGKVENIILGPDGRVRVADVKTQYGIFRRPVSKLCRMNITQSEETIHQDVPH